MILKLFFYKSIIMALKLLRRDAMNLKIKMYRIKGYSIGNNCRIFTKLGGSEPYLVYIGDNVTISNNVTILTHDNSIIKSSNKKYTDLFGKVSIGNNCFIGANSILLPGINLRENTIVAAGSVVTKSVLNPGKIIAGNPARIISNQQSFMKKNESYGFNCSRLSLKERKELIIKNYDKLLVKKNLEEETTQ